MNILNRNDFLKIVHSYNPHFNLEIIAKAYDFCIKAHGNQKRKSGEPYVIHPISVAIEANALNLDEASVVSALLHDVIEDTEYTKQDIERLFSAEIANIVEGVTKFDKVQFKEKDIRQVENFRKLFLALSKDVRVLIIKLCDRLHNMRTIEYQKPEKQKLIAIETLTIYARLAEQIGLQRIKNELQDRSFKILKPDEYDDIYDKIEKLTADFNSNNVIGDIIADLTETMSRYNIFAKVKGRKKTPYSVWRKMKKNNLSFEEISDIMAFRVIVRSLHTKIMGPKGRIVDIQIRTQKMHDEDEFGLAAHWKYKQGLSKEEKMKYVKASWINRVLNILQTSRQSEILNDASIEMDDRRVQAFTKNGVVIDLPYKSTILDFAFEIDKQLGIYFDYGIVNGQIVGVDYMLKNGDKIEIFTTNNPTINKVWLNYVITGKAKNGIIEFLSH